MPTFEQAVELSRKAACTDARKRCLRRVDDYIDLRTLPPRAITCPVPTPSSNICLAYCVPRSRRRLFGSALGGNVSAAETQKAALEVRKQKQLESAQAAAAAAVARAAAAGAADGGAFEATSVSLQHQRSTSTAAAPAQSHAAGPPAPAGVATSAGSTRYVSSALLSAAVADGDTTTAAPPRPPPPATATVVTIAAGEPRRGEASAAEATERRARGMPAFDDVDDSDIAFFDGDVAAALARIEGGHAPAALAARRLSQHTASPAAQSSSDTPHEPSSAGMGPVAAAIASVFDSEAPSGGARHRAAPQPPPSPAAGVITAFNGREFGGVGGDEDFSFSTAFASYQLQLQHHAEPGHTSSTVAAGGRLVAPPDLAAVGPPPMTAAPNAASTATAAAAAVSDAEAARRKAALDAAIAERAAEARARIQNKRPRLAAGAEQP